MARPGGSSDDAQKEIRIHEFPKLFGNKCSPLFSNYNESITKYVTWLEKGKTGPMKPVLYGKSNYEISPSTLPSFFICRLR